MTITRKVQSDCLSGKRSRRNNTQTSYCSLHGSLAGLGLLGPAAQEYAHGEDEYQERCRRRRGHQHETAITRLIPGGILCGTNQSDMKGNMHHIDSISKTRSFLPPGKASKGNLLLVYERKEHLSGCSASHTQHSSSRSLPFAILKADHPLHLHTLPN